MPVSRGWGSFTAHPGVDPRCAVCGGRGIVTARGGEHAVAKPCACIGRCTACQDTGWVQHGEGRNAPKRRCAACREPARRIDLYNAAKIPAKHVGSTFESFDHSRAPEVTRAFMSANRWAREYRPSEPNPGLVFFGPVGTGKTHLLAALLRTLTLDHGVSARFVEFSLLLQDLRAGFDRGAPTAELMAPLLSVDVLAIDELGKGRNTEWETVVLDELVSRRYNAMGTLLGTTNFAPRSTGVAVPNLAAARDASAGAAGLADRVGDRVFSRLSEMVRFEPIIAPDFRAQGPARPHGNG